jgi:hypothetical protein
MLSLARLSQTVTYVGKEHFQQGQEISVGMRFNDSASRNSRLG